MQYDIDVNIAAYLKLELLNSLSHYKNDRMQHQSGESVCKCAGKIAIFFMEW